MKIIDNNWPFFKHLLYSTITVTIVLLFDEKYLYEVLRDNWINPIASHISQEPLSLIGLFIISFSFVIWVVRKKNKLFPKAFLYLILIGAVILIRCGTYWVIYQVAFIILILAIYTFLFWLLGKWYVDEEFHPDIGELEDHLNRRQLAKNIVANILSNRTTEDSFNFAIIGGWGSGKSYLFKLIRNQLQKEEFYNETIFLFEFSPWEHSTNDDLEKSLLKELSNNKNQELRSIFKDLLSLFYQDNSDFFSKIFGYIIGYVFNKGTNPKQRLNTFLKNKRIIILLDDIDRLDKSEIRDVLKIIRNALNYRNIYFGVGFDIDYLKHTLFEKDSSMFLNPNKYLDKFFQVKIPMPDMPNIKDYFLRYFNKEFPDLSESRTFSFINEEFNSNMIFNKIKTPRDSENIIYSAKQAYMGLEDDVDLYLLLMLETLKLTDPDTYESIKKNKEHLPYLNQNEITKDDELITLEEKIAPIRVYSILQSTRYPITDAKYYNNYFNYRLGDNQLSISDIFDIFKNSSYQEKYNLFAQIIQDSLGQELFKTIEWLIEDEKFEYSEHNIKIVVKLYELYQGSRTTSIFQPLVSGISNQKNKEELKKRTLNILEKEYFYEVYFILIFSKEEPIIEILNLFERVVQKEHKSINKFLYFTLITFYDAAKFHRNYFNEDAMGNIKKQIELFISGTLINKPWYSLVNFIVNLGYPKRGDSEMTYYGVFDSYIPRLVLKEKILNTLQRNLSSEFPINKSLKAEIIEFISKIDPKNTSRTQDFEYKFSDPNIFD